MPEDRSTPGFLRSRSGLALLGFLAVGGYFVWTEHRAHAIEFLPYALLLLCPLMHFFHGGHGDKGHDHTRSRDGGDRP